MKVRSGDDPSGIISRPLHAVAWEDLRTVGCFCVGPHYLALSRSLLKGSFLALTGFLEQKCRLMGFILQKDEFLNNGRAIDLAALTMSSLDDKNKLYKELHGRYLRLGKGDKFSELTEPSNILISTRNEVLKLGANTVIELYPREYILFDLLTNPTAMLQQTQSTSAHNGTGRCGNPCDLEKYLMYLSLNRSVLERLIPDKTSYSKFSLHYLYNKMYYSRNAFAHHSGITGDPQLHFKEIKNGEGVFSSIFFRLFILFFVDSLFRSLYFSLMKLEHEDEAI
ncbi:MAG: hypothetical protein IJ228_08285 [Succinivibrio sp.]|nr:hypothetical protein [Succinivibrio sp.]